MIKNYLKVAMRYLLRNKGYTTINILGLAIGITCCILIMLFVRSEFSYDKFHRKSDRIYRAWVVEHYDDRMISLILLLLCHLPALCSQALVKLSPLAGFLM